MIISRPLYPTVLLPIAAQLLCFGEDLAKMLPQRQLRRDDMARPMVESLSSPLTVSLLRKFRRSDVI